MGTAMLALRATLVLLVIALVAAAPAFPWKTVTFDVETTQVNQEPCCHECAGTKNKYFSIADDSGPWLCGETCIRDSFYPIFHLFEKNLTKAASNTQALCHENGYTKYNQTVTHGGGGLYCTLDLYECTRAGGCPRPDKF